MNDFDTFWSLYPRKDDKKDARKAFIAATKNTSVDDIIHGLEAQLKAGMFQEKIANAERDGRSKNHYIKLPAGWLRAERWTNEVTPRHRPTYRNGALELLAREAEAMGGQLYLEAPDA